uniref:cGMP-dependent protein kinase n=1 Tax=Glossina palpalis gambiensis TaxID=67801 RepID=A0A1B0AT87_9MUSC
MLGINNEIMACFPRVFFNKQKNSFTPAEDENLDTVFNANSNSVQIGRYIRREETCLFNSNANERLKLQQQQRQSVLNRSNHSSNNINNDSKNIHNLNGNKCITKNEGEEEQNINNKKYQANTKRLQAINGTLLTSHKEPINQPFNAKLKPVKSRRPTALPLEVPSIEEDSRVNSTLEINTALAKRKAKFFIGSSETDDDNDDDDDDDVDSNFSSEELDVEPASCSSPNTLKTSNAYSEPGMQPAKAISTTSCVSLPPFNSLGFVNGRHRTEKVCSTLSNKFGKLTRNDTTFANLSSEQSAKENVHIPPPPPLPSQPLIKIVNRTSKYKRNSNQNKLSSPTVDIGRESKSSSASELPNKEGQTGRASLQPTECVNETSVNLKNCSPRENAASCRLEGGLIFPRANFPGRNDVKIEYIEKDETTRNLIRLAIEKNDFLNNYMDKERKEMVIDAMELRHIKKNSFIINENEEGSEIYVSEEGQFDVIKSGQIIGSFGPATVFGELAILYNAQRFASVRAASNAIVWKIDRDKFRQIMVISGSKEREENLSFLRSAPFLNDLSEEVLDKVVDLLRRKFFTTYTCIVREGDIGNEFFIIRGGTVTIKKKTESGVERVVDRRKRGDFFGEQALLNADRRQASVYADPPGTEVLKLDRDCAITTGCRQCLHKLMDLKKIATLGAGAFGKVDLVAFGENTFALKIIKKIDVVKQDQIEHVYSEKHVMMKCRGSPFVIELYKTFRDDKFVYFLMEACMGGDVWTIMSQRRYFDENTARFIAACVVEAFDFLHSHNIIYRDLKPENLMLTTDGYCKLVDFGFAKQLPVNRKTHTFAGTPEYVAPEIILDRGHDRSADYWALGILIFELLVGKTPFRGQNQIKIYQQILGGIDVVQMPSKIPKPAQGLIRALCKQLPAERLGYQRRGIMDIKKHGWFDGLEWQKLKKKQLISPIKRPITSNVDLRYFGSPDSTAVDHDPPVETSGWDVDF